MFAVIDTSGHRTDVAGVSDVYATVEGIAESMGLYGGHFISGTYAIAYCDDKHCGGHEVARTIDLSHAYTCERHGIV